MAGSQTLRLVDEPEVNPFDPLTVELPTDTGSTLENGVLRTENDDGSLTIDFDPPKEEPPEDKDDWFENLADKIEASELDRISSDLLTGIQSDDDSRRDWLDMRERGLELLGLKIEDPKSDVGNTSAPMEGMATIRHPLLLQSVLRFQANARGELLPASGPVKVRNDTPTKPKSAIPAAPLPLPMQPQQPPPGMGHNGGPPLGPMAGPGGPPQQVFSPPPVPPGGPPAGGPMAMPPAPPPMPPAPGPMLGPGMPPGMPPPGMPGMSASPSASQGETPNDLEELASALETDMNHYLTAVATEYYPDTDRMLFYVGFGGQGFKKVYNCPLRQRPVSESVDAEDIIVSNSATSLENCGRITHRIRMRPSILRRMQLVGAYRDVEIGPAPQLPQQNAVEQKKNEIQGIKPVVKPPGEADHTIYESCCELDIKGFEHKKGKKITGLRCPYKVTIHVESRQILEVRRLWDKDDELCMPKQYFVEYPFVRAMGFYSLGLVHIAGNTTNTLTAAWREMLDSGMFSNFPGFIFNKMFARQLTNQFRVPPGGGIGLDLGQMRVQDAVMPLPYKDIGAGFAQFISHVEEVGQRVAGVAEITIGEGKQEVPVGTTLAMIEQATKVMDAVHKRLHDAQATEFKLLKQRFREDPEAFWRHNKRPTHAWQKEQFLKALDTAELVPVADPNNPTSLHRIAKATAIKVLQQANPAIYDAKAVDTRIMRIVGIDPDGLFAAQAAAPPPDPRVIAIMEKAKTEQAMGRLKIIELQMKQALAERASFDKAKDREARQELERLKIELEKIQLVETQIIHHGEMNAEDYSKNAEAYLQYRMHIDKLEQDFNKHKLTIAAKAKDTESKERVARVKKAEKPSASKAR